MLSTHNIANSVPPAEAAEAAIALASRARQEARERKRTASKKVSLGGSAGLATYRDKEVRFTQDGWTKIRTVSVDDPEEIPNLTLAQKASLREQWERQAAHEAAVAAESRSRAAYGARTAPKLAEMDEDGGEIRDATPERLGRAPADAITTTAAGGRHLADPLTALRDRMRLSKDKAENQGLYDAGNQYRQARHAIGHSGAKAMNLMKDIVDGGNPMNGLADGEYVEHMRDLVVRGEKAIGKSLLPFVLAIVCDDLTVEEAWLSLTRTKSRSWGMELTMRNLREALLRLAQEYGVPLKDKPMRIAATIEDGERFYENKRNRA